jgi:colanic acid biosynthesis glycosyl transferase WcaI
VTRVEAKHLPEDADGNLPLRVLFIGINYFPETTGIAPYTSAMARGLSERGHAVSVLTAHPHYPDWKIHDGYGRWTKSETIDGVVVKRLRHYVPESPRGVNRLASELSFGVRLLFTRWGHPDVVVMVSPALFSTAIAVVRARLSRSRPVINVWVQDIYSLGITETGMGDGAVARLVTLAEKITLRAAAGVVVIHDRFSSHISRRLGVATERIEVVRNWTHLGARVVETDIAATRAQHGWADDETIVLHAGNMGVKQALENVVHAARLADEQASPVRFVLLGNGSQRDELQVLGLGVARLQFIGSLDDAGFQDALASADVLLVNEKPGVSEMAVPSKLTSYFNAGRPVIGATDPNGLTAGEIEAAGGGVIVVAGDPQALLNSAVALGADPRKARSLGQSGFRYRTEVLGEPAAIDKFSRWLQALLAQSRAHKR